MAGSTTEVQALKVIGKLEDTAVARGWAGHDVLDVPDWTPEINKKWVTEGIINKQNFYTASPINSKTMFKAN